MVYPPIKAIGLSTLGLGGVGGPIFVTGYINSQEDFFEYTKDFCLSSAIEATSNGDWKKAQDKLTSEENLSLEFKDLKVKLNTTSDNTKETGEHLKSLCISIYFKTYKTWFFQNDLLLKDLKRFCSLTIEEKLDKEKKLDISDNSDQKNQFKKKMKQLQSHDDDTGATLDEELKKIKDENPKRSDWKRLKNWCKDVYSKPYTGESSTNTLKLAEKYCQKEK